MDPLKLTATAHLVTASTSARTISGTITIFDKLSDDLRLIFKAGALTTRDPIKRVKLLVDHDMSQPVGYMTTFTQDANTAQATFYVPEGAEGDAALADAASGRRDGFSVGVIASAYEFDEDDNFVITSATIHETSLCAIPAFQDAQVENVAAMLAARKEPAMTPEEIAAKAAADAAAAVPVAAAATPPAPALAEPILMANGERQAPLRGYIHTEDRGISLAQAAARVSAAAASRNPMEIQAAIADVLPADDAGEAWLSKSWMGEVWTASRTDRPWIDAFGTTKQLESMEIEGWQWETRPKPAKWAGEKTEVPTNKPKTKKVTHDAGRWAGGWDIDRIFFDLGKPSFLASFWEAAMAEYKQESNTDIGTQVMAALTDKGASPTVLAAIKGVARDLRNVGANASTIFLGLDAFDEYADLKRADVPNWLAGALGSVDIATDTAQVGTLRVVANEDLGLNEVVGLDKRGGTVYEKTPIKIQAFDVAKGGIDLGFYSYGGFGTNDPRTLVKRTVTPVP